MNLKDIREEFISEPSNEIMILQDKRMHGVTPGLNRDYVKRTVDKQAAFVLPYLHKGMNLLDIGCGPGSITMGLAQSVSPGHVTGIDHDPIHVAEAIKSASERNIRNVSFRKGNALSLPFNDCSFDAAFENNVFTHLSQNALQAAKEAYRNLKPKGFFAVRDVDANAVLWGNLIEPLKLLDRLFIMWHQSRGSDITIGKSLPSILREAGFINTTKSVSADTKGNPDETHSHAEITVSLLDGPFGRDIVKKGWADNETVELLKEGIMEWSTHPDAFFANVHVEVIGWKTA